MTNHSGAGTSKNIKWNFEIESKNSEDFPYMTDDTAESIEQINNPNDTDNIDPNTSTDDKKQKFILNLDRPEPRHVCIVPGCDNTPKKSNQSKTETSKKKSLLDELTDSASNLATFVTYICQHDCATNVTTQLKGDVNNPRMTQLSESPVDWNTAEDLCPCSETNSDATSLHIAVAPSAVAPSAPPPYSAAVAEGVQNNQPKYKDAPFNCRGQINLLMETQKELKMKIDQMEERQKAGAALLKQADLMWSDMEQEYKKKIAASKKRQMDLNQQVKEIQESVNKWRRNFTDLDSQKSVLLKCRLDIREKKTQRQNDIKFLEAEMKDLEKKKDQIQKDLESLEGQIEPKKKHAEKEIEQMNNTIKDLELAKANELKKRDEKEQEGIEELKVARSELTNLTKVLMQKKMENQSLEATKNDLADELTQLKGSISTCKLTCSLKENRLKQEIEQLDNEIGNVKSKTQKCTKCNDTTDMQSFCSDCPMCIAANRCEVKDGCCTNAGGGDNCICTDVKLRFIENVLENMYSVLVKQFSTKHGKEIIEAINQCMQNETYGKLNKETREVLKDFIMESLKKNMNMTLVAGAAKTRCEQQPCEFWSGCNDCNCPKGPKRCICVTKLGRYPLGGGNIGKKISPTNCTKHKDSSKHANCGTDVNVLLANCNRNYTNTKAAQCLIEVDHQALKATQQTKTSSHCACPDDLKISSDPGPCKSACNCTWESISETTDCHGKITTSYKNDKANDPRVWKTKKSDVVTYRDIVKVVVHGRNKAAVELFADVIMTSSGDMALEINESVLVSTQMSDLRQAYLSLQLTSFGDYYIDISSACTVNNKLKSSLVKTSAGTALIFIPASMIDTIRGNDLKFELSSTPSKDLSKANSNAGSINNITKSNSQIRPNLYLKHNEHKLAVLRKSGSHTFDVVLDKEYEGEYNKKLSLLFSADKKCNIALKEHGSSISILAENSEEDVGTHVVRSPSGKLKLICSSTTEILNGVETCALTYRDVPADNDDTLPYPNDLRSLIDLSKPKIIKDSSIIEEMGIAKPLLIVPFSAKATQMSRHDDVKNEKHKDIGMVCNNDIVDLFVQSEAIDFDTNNTNTSVTEIFSKLTRTGNVALQRKPQEVKKIIEDIFPLEYFDAL